MSTPAQHSDVIATMIRHTEELLQALTAGRASIGDVADLLEARQALVAGANDGVGTVTPNLTQAAQRLQQLDQQLDGWCTERQREVARRIVAARGRRSPAPATPRVLSQEA